MNGNTGITPVDESPGNPAARAMKRALADLTEQERGVG